MVVVRIRVLQAGRLGDLGGFPLDRPRVAAEGAELPPVSFCFYPPVALATVGALRLMGLTVNFPEDERATYGDQSSENETADSNKIHDKFLV